MLTESKYLAKFRRLQDEFQGLFKLYGDMLLVERLPPVELKTKSGIVVATSVSTHKETMEDAATQFGIVLARGEGTYDEVTGEENELTTKVGDIILLPGTVDWFSAFGSLADYEPYTIGRIRESHVPMVFTDYKKVMEVLNELA